MHTINLAIVGTEGANMSRVRSLQCGLASGAMQGGIGVGGGIIMVSSLTKYARMPQIQAVGTSLPTQIVGNVISGATFAAEGKVDAAAAVCMGASAIFAARFGAHRPSLSRG